MHRMKICMTTVEFPPDTGGVGESVKRIGKMLVELGHEVHVAVFHPKDRHSNNNGRMVKGFASDLHDGLMVHRYEPVPRGGETGVQEFLSDVYAQMQSLHGEERFDLFHAFFLGEAAFLTTLFAREAGRPVITSVRGADLHRNIFHPKQFGQITWALEHSDWVTFVSRDLEHRAHVLVPSLRGRTSAFWNSISPIDFEALDRPALGPGVTGTVVGTFGNFRDKKGIDHLIWACAELAQEIDLSVLLVGDFVPKEKAYWDAFLADSGISDRIVVTGLLPREQALAYHHVTDIFAIPSLRDGCPNTLLEAMLAGQAIVGSNTDAIGEILDDGENGLVVRPGSTEDLVVAVRRLARQPELRRRLGARARATALEALSPAVERERWLRVYDRVISAMPARQSRN